MMAAVLQHQPLARSELDWADLYEGTQAEIVAAGLATADQFPPGRLDNCDVVLFHMGKEISRFERRRKDTENLVYVCRQSQDRFQIFVGQPPDVRARRLQQLSTSLQPADS